MIQDSEDEDLDLANLRQFALNSVNPFSRSSPQLNFYFIGESHIAKHQNHLLQIPSVFQNKCPQSWTCRPVKSSPGGWFRNLDSPIISRMQSSSQNDVIVVVIGSNDVRDMFRHGRDPWDSLNASQKDLLVATPSLFLPRQLYLPVVGKLTIKDSQGLGCGAMALHVVTRKDWQQSQNSLIDNIFITHLDLTAPFSVTYLSNRDLFEEHDIHLNGFGNMILLEVLLQGVQSIVEKHPTFAPKH